MVESLKQMFEDDNSDSSGNSEEDNSTETEVHKDSCGCHITNFERKLVSDVH